MDNHSTGALPNPVFNVKPLSLPQLALGLVLQISINNLGYLADTIKTTRNWPDALLLRFKLRDCAKIEFRDGRIMQVDKNSYPVYAQMRFALSHKIPVSFKDDNTMGFVFGGRPITLEGDNVLRNVFEVFFSEAYAPLDCRGKTVVDVGANIGDTAIYFALKGAKHVFAVEPFHNLFTDGKRNVESNGLADQVTIINCAMSSEDGMTLVDRNIRADVYSRFEIAEKTGPPLAGQPSPELSSVPVLSLRSFVQKYRISDAALKLDCEGEEYAIILNSDTETLRKFSDMIIEFHYGYVDLAKKLESAGFSVKMICAPYFHSVYKNRPCLVGMFHAIRR